MKIYQIIEKNFCSDSRNLKKNDVFFDLISDKKNNNHYLANIIRKKPYLIITQKKINYKNILIVKNVKKFYFSVIKKNIKIFQKICMLLLVQMARPLSQVFFIKLIF